MIRDELEAFDRQHHGRVYRAKIEIWRRWHEWRARRRERAEYDWAYECGCPAPRREKSPLVCPECGAKLMRYKKKEE